MLHYDVMVFSGRD